MASELNNYQCPNCTGPLKFVGASSQLECEYCGSSYSVDEIQALYNPKESEAVAESEQKEENEEHFTGEWSEEYTPWGEEADGMKAYSCPSCGAELICDATTAATSCPYCGNPTVIPGQFRAEKRPDLLVPFKFDKKAAIAALTKHYKGKMLLPRAFSEANHIEEIKGVYVPFWLYDGKVELDIRFKASRSTVHTTRDKRITTTRHFLVRRAGSVSFSGIPADGSSKMPDAHMDAIEPFDYSELKEFTTAYLPGYLADIYDVDAKECSSRIEKRARNTAEAILTSTVFGYDTVIPISVKANVQRDKLRYALMPVWMLSTKWMGKNYLFAMNGQTGKLVGDLPISFAKLIAWFAGISLPLSVLIYLIMGGFAI